MVLASVALVTDAVDGRVARRTGTVSAFGARFDMETDAALLLVLSTYVARDLGLWVLAIGLARYVFLAAKLALALVAGAGASPAVVQGRGRAAGGRALVVAASGLLPDPVATVALVVALALLAESFAHEAWDLLAAPAAARTAALVVTRLTGRARLPGRLGGARRARRGRRRLARGASPGSRSRALVLVGLVLLLPGPAGGVAGAPEPGWCSAC